MSLNPRTSFATIGWGSSYRRLSLNAFFRVLKISEKYFLVVMNSLGTLRRVHWEWLYVNSSSWCSLEATHFIGAVRSPVAIIGYVLWSICFAHGCYMTWEFRREWRHICPSIVSMLIRPIGLTLL